MEIINTKLFENQLLNINIYLNLYINLIIIKFLL